MTLRTIIDEYESGARFSPTTVPLTKSEAQRMVKMIQNPSRFLPKVFNPGWSDHSLHPEPGDIRLLAIVEGPDGLNRIIGRQGSSLYAFPK